MALRDQMAIDADVFFNTDEFAEQVVFTPDGGIPVTITVIITEGADIGRQGGGPMVSAHGFMRLRRSDFKEEKPRGTVARSDGSVWIIGQEISSNFISRKVEIKTRPRAAFKG